MRGNQSGTRLRGQGGTAGSYGALNLPTEVVSSEFLNQEGKKLSSSRSVVLYVRDFLSRYRPGSDGTVLHALQAVDDCKALLMPFLTRQLATWASTPIKAGTQLARPTPVFTKLDVASSRRNWTGSAPRRRPMSRASGRSRAGPSVRSPGERPPAPAPWSEEAGESASEGYGDAYQFTPRPRVDLVGVAAEQHRHLIDDDLVHQVGEIVAVAGPDFQRAAVEDDPGGQPVTGFREPRRE